MKNIIEVTKKGLCYGCSACYSICPEKCIKMEQDQEGFLAPYVDNLRCSGCSLCSSVCIAQKSKSDKEQYEIKRAYAGWSKNKNTRYNSSSGGIYTEIAKMILKSGGNVYGVIFDKKTKKVSYSSSDMCDFDLQRKSKYVEAELGDTYKNIKKDLLEGRQVLFSGTPCYVGGLKAYLGGKYDNLTTCDFICHGRPSSKLFRNHLNYLESVYKSTIENVDFRPKILGWSTLQHLEVKFSNKKVKRFYNVREFYFASFLKNTSLRKSCMRCNFANKVHQADITLADYWQYNKKASITNDNWGISLSLCNTTRGEVVMQEIKNETLLYSLLEEDFSYVFHERNDLNYNLENRSVFFKKFIENDYKNNVNEFYKSLKPKEKITFYLKDRLIKLISFIRGINEQREEV